MRKLTSIIKDNVQLIDDYYLLTIINDEQSKNVRAGQFFGLHVITHSTDPLLYRPISVFDVNGDEITFLYRAVGRGTEILSQQKAGVTLNALGPLGNGFKVADECKSAALVGGGVGMPPLYFLTKTNPTVNFTFYYGGRSKEHILLLNRWNALNNVEVVITTDDGSLGDKGLVIVPFEKDVLSGKFDQVFACGPTPMLRAVDKIAAENNLQGQISLEARMACGVGACLACVCPTIYGMKKRVCADGPAFKIGEVLWD